MTLTSEIPLVNVIFDLTNLMHSIIWSGMCVGYAVNGDVGLPLARRYSNLRRNNGSTRNDTVFAIVSATSHRAAAAAASSSGEIGEKR